MIDTRPLQEWSPIEETLAISLLRALKRLHVRLSPGRLKTSELLYVVMSALKSCASSHVRTRLGQLRILGRTRCPFAVSLRRALLLLVDATHLGNVDVT